MNLLKKTALISLCLGLILSFTSCVTTHHHTHRVVKHDNGKHKGWYKAKKSHANGKSNGKSNGNGGRGKGNKQGRH